MSESPSGPAALASDSALVAVFARLPHVFMLRWRLFVVTLVVVAVGVVAGIYIKRQKFESSARLLVKLDQRDVQLQSEVRYELARNEAVEAVNTQAELLQSPQNISLLLLFSRECIDELRIDEAREVLESVLAIDPEQVDAHLGIARVIYLQGDLSGAAVRAERVLQRDPNYAPAHLLLSRVCLGEGD